MAHRQDTIGALISHCGSGPTSETDGALDAISRLAHDSSLRPAVAGFEPFLRGALDFVDNLGERHVRSLYDSLLRISVPVSDISICEGDGGLSALGFTAFCVLDRAKLLHRLRDKASARRA